MRIRRVPVVAAVVLALLAVQVAMSTPASAATAATTEIAVAGGRSYYLHDQPSDSRRKPLIIALHGFGGSAANAQGTTGLTAWADARGNDVNIAYPEGIDGRWNAGACCGETQADDVGYLRDVAFSVASTTPTSSIFLWGFSNGGMMAITTLCETPGLFSGAAVVESGPAIYCDRPVRVVAVHQTHDATVRYRGGPVVFGGALIGYTLADQASSLPAGSRFSQHLCSQVPSTGTYHSWTSPCWPTTGQVDDLLWSALGGRT